MAPVEWDVRLEGLPDRILAVNQVLLSGRHLLKVDCTICFGVDGLVVCIVVQLLHPVRISSIFPSLDLFSEEAETQFSSGAPHGGPEEFLFAGQYIVFGLDLPVFDCPMELVPRIGLEGMGFVGP